MAEISKNDLEDGILRFLKVRYGKTNIKDASKIEIFNALSLEIMENIICDWNDTSKLYDMGRQAYYFSAEYLMGRALGNNLMNLGIRDEVKEILDKYDINIDDVEEAEEDAGLGNGGLGRLAACFMDSAATMNMPLKGYGLRYSNGLFKQFFDDNGAQNEKEERWLEWGDPWSIRKEDEKIEVSFSDINVYAVPYDVPIIGYGTKNINTLRLWQCEPVNDFDFKLFNNQKYDKAVEEKNRAEDITRVLYPNDTDYNGKCLRLRQEYFLCSASLKDIMRNFKKKNHIVIDKITGVMTVQLNDTHPAIAIPEYIRILMDEEGMEFEKAFYISRRVFNYTNHTILAEALEKWNVRLVKKILPRIYEIIKMIDEQLIKELKSKRYSKKDIEYYKIIKNGQIRMANLAIYMSQVVNGVAKLHTEILKNVELKKWHELYPKKFQNKTNGITPRRWLKLSNPELSHFITELLGNEKWVTDLTQLKYLEKYKDDPVVLRRFMEIKYKKKTDLADYILKNEGISIDTDSIFDIQIKRLHEYKRQLLNAFYILDLYYRLKENPNLHIPKVTFIFGGKAFPGYRRAKSIIRFINAVGRKVNEDKDINGKIKVVFVKNYNVSYAQKLCPAADISKQISTAGKEASGTGNMKLMLNGALTFGTLDGANVEIAEAAGLENNFIFGLTAENVQSLKKEYKPEDYYNRNPSLKRAVDALIDGTFDDDGSGDFEDLYNSLLKEGDQHFLMADFESFKDTEDKVFMAYKDKHLWAKKCFINMYSASKFSSDRTILQYAYDIWKIEGKTLN